MIELAEIEKEISLKRKFVNAGLFYAELNEFFKRELSEDGYIGLLIRAVPIRTDVIIMATKSLDIIGERGRRIKELKSLVRKRFNFPEHGLELYVEKVEKRGFYAAAQAESLRYKLLGGLAVRRACTSIVRYIMDQGAKGCEVVVSGKLRAQRAKYLKFRDGIMISSGNAVKKYVNSATRHVSLRQGVLGIKIKIMYCWDPTGRTGPRVPLPDAVMIREPTAEELATPIPTPMARNAIGDPRFPLPLTPISQ